MVKWAGDLSNSCIKCKYCHELWWWKDYPKDKQIGYCCTFFKDNNEDTVMQLYGDIEEIYCEEFSEK